MSEALAVQQPQRHLQLPESCLFAPTELQIGATLSKDDFGRLGKALSAVDNASDLWQCDYSLYAVKRWGEAGVEIASAATKLSKFSIKSFARIAERFDPSRRFANLTCYHYRNLVCFPVEFTDAWLPTIVEKNFSAKTLRALAVEAYGSDPKSGQAKKNPKRSVAMSEILYSKLKELSPIPKTALFIEQILEEWLGNATLEQQTRVHTALVVQADTLRQQWVAEKKEKKAKREAARLAAVARSKANYEAKRAEREAEKARRCAELQAEAAAQEAAEAREAEYKQKSKQAASTIRGIKPFYGVSCANATNYKTAAGAADAAARYTAAKGYDFEGFKCEKCGSFHIRVDEVKYEQKRQAAIAARPTYAERREAQKAACSELSTVQNVVPGASSASL